MGARETVVLDEIDNLKQRRLAHDRAFTASFVPAQSKPRTPAKDLSAVSFAHKKGGPEGPPFFEFLVFARDSSVQPGARAEVSAACEVGAAEVGAAEVGAADHAVSGGAGRADAGEGCGPIPNARRPMDTNTGGEARTCPYPGAARPDDGPGRAPTIAIPPSPAIAAPAAVPAPAAPVGVISRSPAEADAGDRPAGAIVIAVTGIVIAIVVGVAGIVIGVTGIPIVYGAVVAGAGRVAVSRAGVPEGAIERRHGHGHAGAQETAGEVGGAADHVPSECRRARDRARTVAIAGAVDVMARMHRDHPMGMSHPIGDALMMANAVDASPVGRRPRIRVWRSERQSHGGHAY